MDSLQMVEVVGPPMVGVVVLGNPLPMVAGEVLEIKADVVLVVHVMEMRLCHTSILQMNHMG